MKTFIRSLILLLATATAFAAETVYVQSSKAKIFANPSFQAQQVGTAIKGESLTLLETADQWTKVGFQNRIGWIPSLLVGSKPPQDKITVIKGQNGPAQGDDARRRASASSSAAAARGLRQDERARASEQGQTNYPAVEKMETNKVNEKDVDTFMQAPAK